MLATENSKSFTLLFELGCFMTLHGHCICTNSNLVLSAGRGKKLIVFSLRHALKLVLISLAIYLVFPRWRNVLYWKVLIIVCIGHLILSMPRWQSITHVLHVAHLLLSTYRVHLIKFFVVAQRLKIIEHLLAIFNVIWLADWGITTKGIDKWF